MIRIHICPNHLRGIIPPLISPLIDSDTLDREGLERLIEHVIAGGVHGIFILGTTGEAQSLSYRLRGDIDTGNLPAGQRAHPRVGRHYRHLYCGKSQLWPKERPIAGRLPWYPRRLTFMPRRSLKLSPSTLILPTNCLCRYSCTICRLTPR